MAGFDCSGLVQELLAIQGIDPKGDQTAHALFKYFSDPENGLKCPCDTGALLFFGSESKITHVAMGFDTRIMLEAGGGGSSTESLKAAIQENAFVRLRPWQSRKDLRGIYWPIGSVIEH